MSALRKIIEKNREVNQSDLDDIHETTVHPSLSDQDKSNEKDINSSNWMDFAACKGRTDEFFIKKENDVTYIPNARRICAGCPVFYQCEDYILDFPMGDVHGVWAGKTPRQLLKLQKARGITPSRPTISEVLSG